MSKASCVTWLCTGAALALATAVGATRGFSFVWSSTALLHAALLIGCPLAAAWYCRRRLRHAAAATACHGFAQFSAFSLAILILQYPLAGSALPAVDAELARIDAWFGGDWPTHFAWLTSDPAITRAAVAIYQALLIQVPLTCVIVGLADPRRLRVFLLANTIGMTLCALLSMLLPAESALGYFGTPGFTSDPVTQFHAVRDGTLRALDLGALTGIITFPSYHTLLAVLVGYAFAAMRRLRVAVFLFQFAIVVTTRGVGGHYFADMIAGAALAGVAIWCARWFVARTEAANESAGENTATPVRDETTAPAAARA